MSPLCSHRKIENATRTNQPPSPCTESVDSTDKVRDEGRLPIWSAPADRTFLRGHRWCKGTEVWRDLSHLEESYLNCNDSFQACEDIFFFTVKNWGTKEGMSAGERHKQICVLRREHAFQPFMYSTHILQAPMCQSYTRSREFGDELAASVYNYGTCSLVRR